jgi:uncharacterized protein YqeY
MASELRPRFSAEMKVSMLAKDAARTSTIRMIMAKLKEADIAARPTGADEIADEQIASMLRGMTKSRRESVELYRQGGRPELAEKEEAEIAVIQSFLPKQMDDAEMRAAVKAAITESGAASIKEMGKVTAILKAKHGATMDMGKAAPLVKAVLSGA